ncbi:MAG: hypothetical protein A3H72_03625 [Candidatus Doudnabacteria bacterium RIFCSPLOWO2_02_FULL_48_8]|uniref:R3H domain-containing protein n=1 Tax=Candidatus Doudnabacteria bacterium RIFCSPHIGHO2_01_FULL_46_24 TaxID=1817825 RepID=A0A1F5NT20_9BACT|nr:MAG: hypothetical protein A2720_04660 [Candidatus Doudnabacteria bacterium RIFCSPHIGHO2_01_FULL_46_24]OGE95392.1 MAG: hypothetical protein A3H72_03625 [Candidatus Doudnabacteria bacterium RIFCSPLOWO2_02_FULL_48_8]OGE95842.1 MAG: hypothetical protein A3E98_01610 [Candidatus Doudnabacteria bacterium RIFCSPHIGHO2_12_FULL_48_11]
MNEKELIKQQLLDLLKHMGFDADILERQEEGRMVFNIKTQDAQLLIGKQGANLEALQYIIRAFSRKNPESERFPFALDVDDYKDKRVIYLKELARRAAHQARSSKRSVGLPLMPAFERKVVHDYLSLFADISSESQGMEPNRRVVIRNKKSTPQQPSDDFVFIENS